MLQTRKTQQTYSFGDDLTSHHKLASIKFVHIFMLDMFFPFQIHKCPCPKSPHAAKYIQSNNSSQSSNVNCVIHFA